MGEDHWYYINGKYDASYKSWTAKSACKKKNDNNDYDNNKKNTVKIHDDNALVHGINVLSKNE